MTTQVQGGPALPFATFLILAALGSFIWNTGPLESSRPTSKDDGAYDRDQEFQVPTRLWQDPFKTIFKEVNAEPPKSSGLFPLIENIRKATSGSNKLTVLGVMVSKGSFAEVEERRRRRRYAVLAGLAESSYVPVSSEFVQYVNLTLNQENCPHKIQKTKFAGDNDNGKDEQDKCKEVIPFEWYEKDEFVQGAGAASKQRVLVLWLNDSLFAKYPFKSLAALINTLKGNEKDGLAEFDESGESGNSENKINSLDKSNANNITTYILGPARSEVLQKMVNVANPVKRETAQSVTTTESGEDKSTAVPEKNAYENLTKLGIAGFHILSPTATVADEDLRQNAKLDASNKQIALIPAKGCDTNGPTCVTMLRTISHDGKVIESLKDELALRNIYLSTNDIALISEWDTYFGRALPRKVREHSSKNHAGNIHEFSYLRGIDGRTVGAEDIGRLTASKTKENTRGSSSTALVASDGAPDIRRPVGTGQYDYLRRLAERIKKLDTNLKRQKDSIKGIRAIGILGSDVYDKLLILRTLRKTFPGIVFFTTDLDAQLLHPDEFYWARNLIVASSFDLQLNEDLQNRIPPFRDSYQTSVFLSTLLALKAKINTNLNKYLQALPENATEEEKTTKIKNVIQDTQKLINHWVQPQLFEVGRHGAYPLNSVSAQPGHENHHNSDLDLCANLSESLVTDENACSSNKVHPRKPDHIYMELGLALLFLTGIAIFTLHQVRPKSGLQVMWLIISLIFVAIFVAVAMHLSLDQEPLSFSEGISAWPTTFFRIATMLMAIYFIATSLTNLRNNRLRLNRDYQLFDGDHIDPVAKNMTIKAAFAQSRSSMGKIRNLNKRSLFTILFTLIAMVLMVATRQMLPITQIYCALGAWLVFLLLWYGYIYKFADVLSINKWVEKLDGHTVVDVKWLWKSYCETGVTRHRVYRSLTMAFLYMSFATIVFFLFPSGSSVWRGTGSMLVGIIFTMIPVVIMIFLIFFVTDATRLCICWIRALGQKELVWDQSTLEYYKQKLNVKTEFLHEWLKIKLIADRTHEVGQLIYYPFIIIILMLVSRSTYFDNWGFPQALAIVVTINLVILSSVAVIMRKQAESVRQESISNLEHELVNIAGCRSPDSDTNRTDDELKQQKCHREQINKLLDEIKNIREGAFRSVLDQPLVRAGLILLGGLGFGLSEYSFLLW